MSVSDLKQYIQLYNRNIKVTKDMKMIVEKNELLQLATLVQTQMKSVMSTKYDLICNICHDSPVSQVYTTCMVWFIRVFVHMCVYMICMYVCMYVCLFVHMCVYMICMYE